MFRAPGPDHELPFSLEEALKRLQNAAVLPAYFGAEALLLYREGKAVELARFRKAMIRRKNMNGICSGPLFAGPYSLGTSSCNL